MGWKRQKVTRQHPPAYSYQEERGLRRVAGQEWPHRERLRARPDDEDVSIVIHASEWETPKGFQKSGNQSSESVERFRLVALDAKIGNIKRQVFSSS
jgi:hypothetical protein